MRCASISRKKPRGASCKQSLVRPIDGLIALGDRATTTAAFAARALAIAYNSPEAVENCRSKLRQREILRDAGLPVPGFFSFRLDKKLDKVLPRVQFPCVVKPLRLAASQGVIRANNAEEFQAAVERIGKLLKTPEIQVTHEAGTRPSARRALHSRQRKWPSKDC